MPTIGIAGVTIPGAVDCISKINRHSSHYFASNHHPHVILFQPNFGILQSAFRANDRNQVLLELSKSVEALAQMGADFVIIPANTVHRVIRDLQKQSSVPILNMLQIVCDECKDKRIKKMKPLGQSGQCQVIFINTLEAHGLEEVIPSEEEQKMIQDAIFPNSSQPEP